MARRSLLSAVMRLPAIVILAASLVLASTQAHAKLGRADSGQPKAERQAKVKTPWKELTPGGKVKRVAWKATKGVGITVGLLAATVLIPHGIAELQGNAGMSEHHQLWQLPATFGAYGAYRVAKWQLKEKLQARREKKAAAQEQKVAAREGELASTAAP